MRLGITDRDAYQPVLTALAALVDIHKMNPQQLGRGPMLQMLGSAWAAAAVRRHDEPRDIFRRWEAENAGWKRIKAKYALYPGSKTLAAEPCLRPSLQDVFSAELRISDHARFRR